MKPLRIVVLGGGPAGLYFALLMKKREPRHRVTVLERNPAGATFGWGVVFSDRTLSYLEAPDPESFAALEARLETWDNVDVVHRGERVTIRGNRFSGIARLELLGVLQRRCLELGVDLRFEAPVADLAALPEHDLLIGADGVNSLVRQSLATLFEPSLDVRRNRFAWYGTPRLFKGLTLTFREDEAGLFVAHSYQYSPALSTFIVECDEDTWSGAGFGARAHTAGGDGPGAAPPDAGDAATRARLERVFADDLAGAPLLSNRSLWIRFATVRNRRWHGRDQHGRHVALLGDALHTAHFSIGSGTKLALEDAIALADCCERHPEPGDALPSFEEMRRPQVEQYQAAAQRSLEWFETARQDLHLSPLALAWKAMTRSEKVDRESLRRRDPEFVAAYESERSA